MTPTPTASASSAIRRLARAEAVVRTEMGHRARSHDRSRAIGAAVRARRVADRLDAGHRIAAGHGIPGAEEGS